MEKGHFNGLWKFIGGYMVYITSYTWRLEAVLPLTSMNQKPTVMHHLIMLPKALVSFRAVSTTKSGCSKLGTRILQKPCAFNDSPQRFDGWIWWHLPTDVWLEKTSYLPYNYNKYTRRKLKDLDNAKNDADPMLCCSFFWLEARTNKLDSCQKPFATLPCLMDKCCVYATFDIDIK